MHTGKSVHGVACVNVRVNTVTMLTLPRERVLGKVMKKIWLRL